MPLPIIEYVKEFFTKDWAERFFNPKTPPVEKPDRFIEFPAPLKNKCFSCSKIEEICPVDAIGPGDGGESYPYIDKDRCIRCARCADICPNLVAEMGEIRKISKMSSSEELTL
ncbi:hypothetical protein AKJ50_02150 [candidate division MSBL1 archaeon SCGC-AAA382A13]|uniref:4Fe-4S ferredoxin-type domain-containing protein n=1 Tax=candidate division MSBL1 archaeon SCGC-AAA382A13 TaxID=1698279 RepID=A0A133VDY9_9EURY|nr:hypothetical protein AKJ50_02150 [candidate division MSBL1 archaeon SCGC-AAA382A13]